MLLFSMQQILLLFFHLTHFSLNQLLSYLFFSAIVCLIHSLKYKSYFTIFYNFLINIIFFLGRHWNCVSHDYTRTHTLLFYLILILIDLTRLVYSLVSAFFSFLWPMNFQMIIWFWHKIVSSLFSCYKFNVSMLSHIFHDFTKDWVIHELKKIFFKAFFLSSAFISMYGFSQVFWLNLMIL